MKPYYKDSQVTIYHGNSLDLFPEFVGADLVLSDPPYGIGFNFKAKRSRKSGLDFGANSAGANHDPDWSMVYGDDKPFDPQPWLGFKNILLWGANNFANKLPASRGWLIWDKLGDKNPCAFGDCELAWTNKDMSTRIHRQIWRGLVREGVDNVANGPKLHPCQKPIELIKWCLSFFEDCQMVLDPYMGSGTTLRAAKDHGKKAIGVDIEEKYCEIAANRMSQEVLIL